MLFMTAFRLLLIFASSLNHDSLFKWHMTITDFEVKTGWIIGLLLCVSKPLFRVIMVVAIDNNSKKQLSPIQLLDLVVTLVE